MDALPRRRGPDGRGDQGRRPYSPSGRPSPAYWQGLTADHIRTDADTSRRNLELDRLHLYYAHIDDHATPLEETVDALAGLAEAGTVGLLGCSNTALWRIERGRGIARTAGRPAYSCVQQQHSYLLPIPQSGQTNLVTAELIDYTQSEGLHLLAYSPLLKGLYARDGQPSDEYAHAGNAARLAVLHDVARELGATANQLVLAWLLNSRPAVIPIPGASSVEQLDEMLDATELSLDEPTMTRLNGAGRTDSLTLASAAQAEISG